MGTSDEASEEAVIALTSRRTHPPAGVGVRPSGLRFERSHEGTVLTGVAAGLGRRWGVDPVLVRLAFAVTAPLGGIGVFAYLAAWAVALDPGDPRAPRPREATEQRGLAFGLIVLGAVLVLRETPLWIGDTVGLPLLLAAVGTAVIYVRTDADRRPAWTRGSAVGPGVGLEKPSLVRVVVGGVLVVAGMGAFLAANRTFAAVGTILLAVAVTSAGLVVVFGPWVWRLIAQLGTERRDRIRSQERADLAAHLHDSVLQTLALIQRNAGDPRKMLSLARRQERELRAWLYAPPQASDGAHLNAVLQSMAQRVEESHDVPVEVVVVGDCPLDERVQALVHACQQAVANAAMHSGADVVSVYVECEPGSVTAYVRDRGRGFEVAGVPADRRGIADSIVGRVERHGGTVRITSALGEGCEVQLRMPRETA